MPSQHQNLAEALAAFQASLPRIGRNEQAVIPGKDGKAGFKYLYANLADVSQAVLPLLAAHGLSFTATPTVNAEGRFVLEYALRHTSGEQVGGVYPLVTGTPQQMGSSITYARRYALQAVTGVAPADDDDDAAAASIAVPVSTPVDPVTRARAYLASTCNDNQWDLGLVAAKFHEKHAVSLRDCNDPAMITKFRDSLFELPDATLRTVP